MKLGKNEPCWCGSGEKYKRCHLDFDEKLEELHLQGIPVPPHSMIKNKKQIDGIRESGVINTALLDEVAKSIHEGITTEEIDDLVYDFTMSHGAVPATLGYEGFPKSCCTSVNNEICHGIPSDKVVLREGDIVNVDVTTIYRGYFADASRMFCIGQLSPDAEKIVRVARECLEAGIAAVRPWGRLGDIGAAIQAVAQREGCSIVRDIGGHGVGLEMHEDPYVCHVGHAGTGMVLAPGMVFTVEPMVNLGTDKFFIDKGNGWTVYTKDGKLSAQWEHTLAVTETGIEILTY
ncbi:MAG TPA: methionyl aminopeptidase [Candidatus Gallacutalibacter pullicola]|uniref:Methionine aminopeptidase n=1 Tax=Candidatus Gallacutalibacter pullicola TaxID=2840830 RepID=A0A9D1DRL4_9FIRM|nr:methionyl aminopeptidase [Candidatus Gallacutalibacter pullicola]